MTCQGSTHCAGSILLCSNNKKLPGLIMTTDRIRQDILLAITGYRTQLVEFERIVDAEGYQPTTI